MTPPDGSVGAPEGAEVGLFRMFDLDFGLRCDDPELGGLLGSLLAPFLVDGDPRCWYDVESTAAGGAHRVLLDGVQVLEIADHFLVGVLLWHLNQRVMLETRSHLLVHAGAVSLGGQAVVFPGDADAGKSTLVAALVADGFSYLSDEAAAVDLETGMVCPYPRAIALERGSWPLLPALEPPGDLRRRTEDLWLLTGEDVRPGSTSAAHPCGAVVFPQLHAGTAARLTPLSRAESVRRLARRSTNLAALGERGFRAVVALVDDATCWELRLDGVDAAVRAVRTLLTEREGSRGPAHSSQ
ncbi:MAG: hypothetical protein ACLGHQ_12245 [Acidimicrobiia bacterium]